MTTKVNVIIHEMIGTKMRIPENEWAVVRLNGTLGIPSEAIK